MPENLCCMRVVRVCAHMLYVCVCARFRGELPLHWHPCRVELAVFISAVSAASALKMGLFGRRGLCF